MTEELRVAIEDLPWTTEAGMPYWLIEISANAAVTGGSVVVSAPDATEAEFKAKILATMFSEIHYTETGEAKSPEYAVEITQINMH